MIEIDDSDSNNFNHHKAFYCSIERACDGIFSYPHRFDAVGKKKEKDWIHKGVIYE